MIKKHLIFWLASAVVLYWVHQQRAAQAKQVAGSVPAQASNPVDPYPSAGLFDKSIF